jgi:hypothetical protein
MMRAGERINAAVCPSDPGGVRTVCVPRRLAVVLSTAAVVLGTAVVAEPAAGTEVFTVYLSPIGSDTNSGRSASQPVKTLAQAQVVIKDAAPRTDVEVRIKQGVYQAPPLVWDTVVVDHTISFMPEDYHYGDADTIAGRPVFDGGGQYGYWLNAKAPVSFTGAMSLRFYYLQVQNYTNGLVFHGKVTTNSDGIRVPSDIGVNHNTVYGMMFIRVGSKFAPPGGTGALKLQNSSDNDIRNNHFVDIVNPDDTLSAIHAIYIAHYSKRNLIEGNRFERVSGDPVRIRNDSNDNIVERNVFNRTGAKAFYGEWFCDLSCVGNNPGHPRECASHGNWFRYNDAGLKLGYLGTVIPFFDLTPAGNTTTGGTGCDNEGQDRLRTASNRP